jgi:hypothetical protein
MADDPTTVTVCMRKADGSARNRGKDEKDQVKLVIHDARANTTQRKLVGLPAI